MYDVMQVVLQCSGELVGRVTDVYDGTGAPTIGV